MANPLKILKLKPTHFQFIQELNIDAPPARVWKALLSANRWFEFDPSRKGKGCRIEAWVGGRFYVERANGSSSLYATITHIEPNKLLRMCGPMGASHVPAMNAFIFELNPKGKGTLFRFAQRTFGYLTPGAAKDYQGGWKKLFEQLKRVAESRK